MIDRNIQAFWQHIQGKRIAVCGIGHNNLPVIRQLTDKGAQVLACDRRDRAQLGQTADELEAAGHIARSGRHISLPDRERMRRAFGLS